MCPCGFLPVRTESAPRWQGLTPCVFVYCADFHMLLCISVCVRVRPNVKGVRALHVQVGAQSSECAYTRVLSIKTNVTVMQPTTETKLPLGSGKAIYYF